MYQAPNWCKSGEDDRDRSFMTTFSPPTNPCPVCFRTGTAIDRWSLSTRLEWDERPLPLLRDEAGEWISICAGCGLVADAGLTLSAPVELVRAVVGSDAYAEVGRGMPPLAREFLRAAHIAQAAGQPGHAGWSRLQAAWACDDFGAGEEAAACRDLAVECFRSAICEQPLFADGARRYGIYAAECLRRNARFEEAERECDLALISDPTPEEAPLLRFVRRLAVAHDADVHAEREAFAEAARFVRRNLTLG